LPFSLKSKTKVEDTEQLLVG